MAEGRIVNRPFDTLMIHDAGRRETVRAKLPQLLRRCNVVQEQAELMGRIHKNGVILALDHRSSTAPIIPDVFQRIVDVAGDGPRVHVPFINGRVPRFRWAKPKIVR